MATAPTRQASCLNCRRRRVKCNREIPACGACQRLRLECFYRNAGADLLWMPIELIDADFEPIGKRSSDQDDISIGDHSVSEKAPHPRRTPLSSEKEKKAMSQYLLQSIEGMNIDDAIQFLSTSVEGGTEAISIGPFGAFPTQVAEKMGLSSTLQGLNPSVAVPSPGAVGNSSSLSHPLINQSPVTDMHPVGQDENNVNVNILASILGQDWERLLPGANLDALPHGSVTNPSLYGPKELHPGVHPSRLPSPLSDYLPFLYPSEILQRVPKDTFVLLEYYGSKMLFFLSPLPNQKPPWKIIHHPSVLEITGALLLDQPVKHAQLALLHAILAISSFHLDWCATFNQHIQARESHDRAGRTESYWRKAGEQHTRKAKAQLQLALKHEFFGVSRAKYKHILMTLLCMVTIQVQTGCMEEGRCFLLDAERAIRLRGLKPYRSRKIRLLHNIFLYNRILEESTFLYPHADAIVTNKARRSNIQDTAPSVSGQDPEPSGVLGENDAGVPLDSPTYGNEKSLVDQLITSDGAWFEAIYGVPINLMSLISQATSLACEADNQQLPFQSTDLSTLASFTSRVRALEELICAFQWEPTQGTQGDPAGSASVVEQGLICYGGIMRPLVSAMHQALLIFFYRRILKMNSYALQPFVKRTISELFAFQHAKAENSIVTPVPCWPGFVAGCEALEDEDRQRVRQWFEQAGGGWRSFDTVGKLLEKFWVSRELQSVSAGVGFGDGEVTWERFFKEQGVAIITT